MSRDCLIDGVVMGLKTAGEGVGAAGKALIICALVSLMQVLDWIDNMGHTTRVISGKDLHEVPAMRFEVFV